jgi:hypothetical protein
MSSRMSHFRVFVFDRQLLICITLYHSILCIEWGLIKICNSFLTVFSLLFIEAWWHHNTAWVSWFHVCCIGNRAYFHVFSHFKGRHYIFVLNGLDSLVCSDIILKVLSSITEVFVLIFSLALRSVLEPSCQYFQISSDNLFFGYWVQFSR